MQVAGAGNDFRTSLEQALAQAESGTAILVLNNGKHIAIHGPALIGDGFVRFGMTPNEHGPRITVPFSSIAYWQI